MHLLIRRHLKSFYYSDHKVEATVPSKFSPSPSSSVPQGPQLSINFINVNPNLDLVFLWMDNNFQNYHQWRQGPTQPNICPVCTAPHFPFCQPSSFPHNPHFPPHFNPPRPGFDSFVAPPARPQNHYPLGDPRPWQPHHANQWRPVSDHRGVVDCDREADRSYKRARIDAIGGGQISWEDERRLKMVRDHGYGVAPPPPYGGYFGGPNGQPPLPVSPPPPLPPSHPSSMFTTATSNSSASYPQMPNASVMLLFFVTSKYLVSFSLVMICCCLVAFFSTNSV